MQQIDEGRRSFLREVSITAMALPLLMACEGSGLAQRGGDTILDKIKKNARPAGTEGMGAIDVPADVSWRTALATSQDEGEPMVISGTIFQSDGKTPAPNVLIYLYHTDAHGIYGRAGQHKHGKHRGWMLTDEKGRYEFSSIRPASYPNSTQSRHVHMTLTGVDFREDWVDSILFEGDRFLTERERRPQRGVLDHVVKLEKDAAGIGRAVRNIQLS
jgi:protocatechuate 3,4-dioxygenase, beta subunit